MHSEYTSTQREVNPFEKTALGFLPHASYCCSWQTDPQVTNHRVRTELKQGRNVVQDFFVLSFPLGSSQCVTLLMQVDQVHVVS